MGRPGQSLEFAQEIEQSSRWNGVLHWDALSGPAKNRSTRLLGHTSKCLCGPRSNATMLINAFLEGVSLDAHTGALDLRVARDQVSNGYELLRQMTVEYSLQSRSEALALRTALVNRTFSVKSSEGGNSQVADVIRRIDYEAARFSRLLGTLPPSVDATGLGMPEADLVAVAFEEFTGPCHDRLCCTMLLESLTWPTVVLLVTMRRGNVCLVTLSLESR